MEERKVYGYRWVVLIVYMFITILTQLFWLNFVAVETFVEEHLGVTAMQVGWLALVYPLAHIIISIPSGMLIDRKGIRTSIGIGALLVGFFGLFRLLNPDSYTIILLSQIGIGAGTPFILNGITKVAITWFPVEEEATAVSLGTVALFLGMFVGLGITPMLLDSYGYHTMIQIFSVLGVLGTVIFFIFVKDKPPTPSRTTEVDTQIGDLKQWKSLGNILRIRDFVILSIVFLLGTGIFNGIATWFEKILSEMHGIGLADVGYVSGLLIIGAIIGCIVIPVISDKVMKRKPFCLLAVGGGGLGIAWLLFPAGLTMSMVNSFVLGFFLVSALPILMTLAVEYTGEEHAGISLAWLWMVGNLFALIVVPSMEFLRSETGKFIWPILLIVILITIGFILAFALREPELKVSPSAKDAR